MKKLNINYCGECQLKQLPEGTYFRTINKQGIVSKETYTKLYYEKTEKKYMCEKHSDAWGNGKLIKGEQLVTTDFIY